MSSNATTGTAAVRSCSASAVAMCHYQKNKAARVSAQKVDPDSSWFWSKMPWSVAKKTVKQRLAHEDLTRAIYLPSFVALGTVDVILDSAAATGATVAVETVGAVFGAGIILSSVIDYSRAETAEDQLDAASDLAWGGQGLLYLTYSATAKRIAVGLGSVGAVTQLYVGARRLRQALADDDRQKMKLGALDLGGGLLWLGWDLCGLGQPLVVGSYVVLMVAREAYASRSGLKRFMQRLGVCAAPTGYNEYSRLLSEDEYELLGI